MPPSTRPPLSAALRGLVSCHNLTLILNFSSSFLPVTQPLQKVVRVLAELVAKKGQLDRAVELDRHLVNLLPEDALARYNLGCSLARAGCSKEAISALSQAILLGYDDLHHLEVDPDLDSLRDHPDFKNLLDED